MIFYFFLMKNYLIRLLKYLLFIFLLFELGRIAFLVTYHSLAFQSSFGEVLSTFYHAFHLDVSAASYLFVIPFLLLTLQLAFQAKWLNRVQDIYTLIVVLALTLSSIGDICLYGEWGFKLNYKIWYYLQKPDEVLRTATWGQLIVGGLATLLLTAALFWSYKKWFSKPDLLKINKFYWQTSLLAIVGLPLIFVGMRGKITGIPISQSNAYFSKNPVLNDAAVNTQWNLLKSTIRFAKSNQSNAFATMDEKKAEEIVRQMYKVEKDTCIRVLNEERPNIVVILLESWSADLIESLGGEAGITPYFRELEKEGLLFTQLYASGRRSQEGISSLISGFPPLQENVVTDNFEKYSHLNSLATSLKRASYTEASFYFGGDITYGNLKAYLMAKGFDRIVSEDDFPSTNPHGKLCIHDEYVYNLHLQQLENKSNPFFTILFTGSSHSPYDYPPQRVAPLKWSGSEGQYVNSAHYADWALGRYFAKAKKEGWYDHTLFILIADHSHHSYKEWNYNQAEYQRIPMMWLGGALKEEWRGKQIEQLCSSLDIPKTLLNQLSLESSEYQWSKDVMNPYSPQFAMAQHNAGILWITSLGSFTYEASTGQLYQSSFSDKEVEEREVLRAKAFLQVSYQKYLDL